MTDTTAPITTLVVDDVEDLRFLVRMALEQSGHFRVVGEAGDGEAAVVMADQHKPDLVLLDISMPIQDGLEALPKIKSVSPTTKVVMLSGFEAHRLAEASLSLGAIGYIEKGVSPQRLVRDLVQMVRGDDLIERPRIVRASPAAGQSRDEEPSPIDVEELLSFAAHEIRNPLTVVQGLASALETSWSRLDPDQIGNIAQRIAANARYLDGVVKSIFLLGGVHSGDLLVESSVESVDGMMREITGHLRDVAGDHMLETEIHPGLPPVRTDPARFRQVLTNLVVNAAKYSPVGSPILIRARRDLASVIVEVVDRGPGFPRDTIARAFDKFSRFHATGSGLGLGLYISRRLMHAMGGEIWIKNDPAGGAIVACRLPVST